MELFNVTQQVTVLMKWCVMKVFVNDLKPCFGGQKIVYKYVEEFGERKEVVDFKDIVEKEYFNKPISK